MQGWGTRKLSCMHACNHASVGTRERGERSFGRRGDARVGMQWSSVIMIGGLQGRGCTAVVGRVQKRHAKWEILI